MIRRRVEHWRVSAAGTATGTCIVAWRSSLAGAFSQCDTFLPQYSVCRGKHGKCQQRTAAAMSQVCPSLQTPSVASSSLPFSSSPAIYCSSQYLTLPYLLILTPHLISSCHDLILHHSLSSYHPPVTWWRRRRPSTSNLDPASSPPHTQFDLLTQ
jgi:hypothetical protein